MIKDAQKQQHNETITSNVVEAEPLSPTNMIEFLDHVTKDLPSSNTQAVSAIVDGEHVDSSNSTTSSNDYDTIMDEIQSHEKAMEVAINSAEEISKELKDSIMYYLKIRSANRNGILFRGVPDVLQASARLLDISISGRYKIASLKKLRASILKDKNGGASGKEDFNLLTFLNEN
jgi:hypothetical protein|nr:MAG TPA: hypothetical protein [Caudoviricetes sp.]